ncbi:MAG: response regulator transcription factor [Oscillospiraceae bacterium]|nr:response regulator transcription factor [Oscillospiraceae bacterium]
MICAADNEALLLHHTTNFIFCPRDCPNGTIFALNSKYADWQSDFIRGKIKMECYIPKKRGGIAMYIAVCDDQAQELEHLENLLRTWQAEHKTSLRYSIFQNAIELLSAAEKERFTLYLLDVMMPGTDGISAAREIRNFDDAADIVFLTSSPDFAYASYGVHALDYLLKPIEGKLLFPILDRLLVREQEVQEALLLKSGATLIRIPFSDLTCVEVINKHLYYYLADGTVHKVPGTLNQCESVLLSRPEFKQIHRSYIVNLLQVSELSPTSVKTLFGRTLPVSRRFYPELQRDYVNLLFSREG